MKKSIINKVVWFTGLSGSGKTTISLIIKKKLDDKSIKIKILDGDVIRASINKNLSFSKEDILLNNKLIAQLARDSLKSFDVILVPIISPFNEGRLLAKKIIGEDKFVELFISTPIDECKNRDPKGLYKKAMNGEIKNFIGLADDSPYEIPLSPGITADTINRSPEEVANYIIENLLVNEK
tara:strand:- start:297 stop:839 length:543 start_codon:yes stop_codon:yes gene_type:complete